MDKEIFEQGRTPYYVEDYNSDKIIPKTLIVNYATKKAFVNSAENIKVPLAESDIKMKIKNKIKKYRNRASLRGNTLKKIQEILTDVQKWVDDVDNITSDGSIKSVYDLLKLFKDMEINEGTIKEQLESKMDRVEGKMLSEVCYNAEMKKKLDSIEVKANKFIHPTEKVCNFKSAVSSVNNKVGDVVLTKDDIGLADFNLSANNYTHPIEKTCSTNSILSVNGKKGDVKISLEDLGLNKLKDAKVFEGEDIPNESDGYITPLCLNNFLKRNKLNIINYINNRFSNKTIKIKVLAGETLESNINISNGDFISTAKIEVIYKETKVSTNGILDITLPYGIYFIKVTATNFFDKTMHLIIDDKVKNGDLYTVYLDQYYEEYDLNIPDNIKYINVVVNEDINPFI